MQYLESSYQHYPHPHEQLPTGLPSYAEAQAMHNYAMVQQSAPMLAMPAPPAKTNETKPRLGKDEVDILEREFKKNPKPTTQTKRVFAEDMGVDLARINNWFQNRRAKRKQEKRQEAQEAQEALGYSEPSSPDLYSSNGYYSDNIVPLQHSATFPMMNGGPPPAAASYNPQYSNPASASMESLHRTFAAAQAGRNSIQPEFDSGFLEQNDSLTAFGGPLIQDSTSSDRAQFPSSEESVSPYDNSQTYSYPSSYSSNLFVPPHPVAELQASPEQTSDHTPTPFTALSGPEAPMPQLMTTFPSQLLPSQAQDAVALPPNDGNTCQSPEEAEATSIAIGFRYEIQGSEDAGVPPPSSSIPFRSPPPPMDIASRRKKVHVKPAALTADTLRGRPPMGPRTVSHAEGFRRQSDSPISSPMRRIASAGGNRNGISGRIQKPTIESAQRSPINFNGFADAGAFMEHNYQSIRNPPVLTAGSSLNNSLAPPTPMSPREREMTLARKDSSKSSGSPIDGSMNFVFNAGVPGCFTTMEGDQNLASPPETPQAQLGVSAPSHGWPAAIEFPEKPWQYEVPDEPLFTPAQDGFPLEIHMPQPTFLSSMSQPVTPAFGPFGPNFMFGHDSPQLKTESPTYTLSTQSNSEYSFPESQSYFTMGKMPSPVNKQKTFQFSNSTAADFSEK